MENRISQGRLAEGPLPFVYRERSGSGDWGYFCWPRQLVERCQLFFGTSLGNPTGKRPVLCGLEPLTEQITVDRVNTSFRGQVSPSSL